jgi:hypothetical protein
MRFSLEYRLLVAGGLLSGLVAAAPAARNELVARGAPQASASPAPPPPPGGLGTNSTPPVYHPGPPSGVSDFDFQSLNLALNQEYIELDLFHHGLAQFSVEEFEKAGLNAEDRFLIEFMADQEQGHAEMITNILGRMFCGIPPT